MFPEIDLEFYAKESNQFREWKRKLALSDAQRN